MGRELDYEKYYKWGLFSKVRKDRFDSWSESVVCITLNRILEDYMLGEVMQLRLTPQQALDNYVEPKVDGEFMQFEKNRHKWMKFDFIFEEVYEYHEKMHYIPVCVVEFDGPYHQLPEQRKRDYYKNGVAVNIGAQMVRISYEHLQHKDDQLIRDIYTDEILNCIIRGYFTRSVNHRKEERLIGEHNIRKFELVVGRYEKILKEKPDKAAFATHMLQLLYLAKETGYASSN